MTIYLPELDSYSLSFPSPTEALEDPNGLLALGGDLKEERLLEAYSQGVFPWYTLDEPILWWSPTPRAIFFPAQFTPSKSLKKFYRKSNYKISINHQPRKIIEFCGSLRQKEERWLHKDMQKAYIQLADSGHCHSVEVWQDNEIIGGLYGIQIGKIFCGESMFSLKTNASKIALWAFCKHFHLHGGKLIDCQVLNPHTKSLGAQEITRSEFLNQLISLRNQNVDARCYQSQWLDIPSMENW